MSMQTLKGLYLKKGSVLPQQLPLIVEGEIGDFNVISPKHGIILVEKDQIDAPYWIYLLIDGEVVKHAFCIKESNRYNHLEILQEEIGRQIGAVQNFNYDPLKEHIIALSKGISPANLFPKWDLNYCAAYCTRLEYLFGISRPAHSIPSRLVIYLLPDTVRSFIEEFHPLLRVEEKIVGVEGFGKSYVRLVVQLDGIARDELNQFLQDHKQNGIIQFVFAYDPLQLQEEQMGQVMATAILYPDIVRTAFHP